MATVDETGRPQIVPNREGANLTPSCVSATSPTAVEVGEFSRRQWGTVPNTAAARFKRDMGTSTIYKIGDVSFTPTQLSTFVLKKLRADAEATLGPLGEAVVTIPANFAHEAREATLAAAKAAGLNVKYIVNEPTAAALYYAFKTGKDMDGIYAVYDLGGGTFDISIIRAAGQNVEVLATNGVPKLGGDDFDVALQKLVQRKFRAATGEELEAIDFTRNDAEEEKKSLSSREKVTCRVNRRVLEIGRAEFEEAISTYIVQAEMLCESTMEEAKVSIADVAAVFLVGGSTRVPAVQESVRRLFGREPVSTANVDEVVALGAALYAAYKGDRRALTAAQRSSIDRIRVAETTSKCFGTISLGEDATRNEMKPVNSVIIRKGARIPCNVARSFYTVHDGQRAVACKVTESIAAETDPRFVKIIWQGELELPEGRPANQEIRITFAYDENQIMKCSFEDVATKRVTKIDLSFSKAQAEADSAIDKFLVE
jgi:molecular chaperone DnaK